MDVTSVYWGWGCYTHKVENVTTEVLPSPPLPPSPHSLVPVGQLHHDVEGGQKHQCMEEGVAVGDPILLIIHIAHSLLIITVFSICAKPTACTSG